MQELGKTGFTKTSFSELQRCLQSYDFAGNSNAETIPQARQALLTIKANWSFAMAEITKIVCRWDDQPGVEPGWYCEAFDAAGDFAEDSQKVWFAVNVDEYTADQWQELRAALQAAYPSAVAKGGN